MGLLVGLMDIATANNTVAIVMANPIAKEMSKDYGISARKLLLSWIHFPVFSGDFTVRSANAGCCFCCSQFRRSGQCI